jgi:hypothetical protein
MSKRKSAKKGTKKGTAKRKKNSARRSVVVITKAAPRKRSKSKMSKPTKRKKSRIGKPATMKGDMMNKLIHGGAAFGGGYASSYVADFIPLEGNNAHYATAGLGLVLTMVAPKGAIGAAGLGMIGGAGRAMADGGGGSTVTGSKRSKFRRELRARMNGVPRDRMVITGQEEVITGTDNVTASNYSMVAGAY